MARCIAGRALELACQAIPNPTARLLRSASDLRQHLLAQQAPYVSLPVLLEYRWDAGIPVLHVTAFPHGSRKMEAMAAKGEDCPGIVLCSNRKASAWLLFHLAHELGHIALGHVDTVPFLVDEKVETSRGGQQDPEEAEANQFAIELLPGVPELWAPGSWMTIERLAGHSKAAGRAYRIDPGTIALNYGWTRKHWPTVTGALSLLEPEGDGPATVRAKMVERLKWDELPEESQEYLLRITGASRDCAPSSITTQF